MKVAWDSSLYFSFKAILRSGKYIQGSGVRTPTNFPLEPPPGINSAFDSAMRHGKDTTLLVCFQGNLGPFSRESR